jgi:hypothetical protein
LRQSEYTTREGERRTGLQVAASKCDVLGIGNNKPRKAKSPREERPAANGQISSEAARQWQKPLDAEIPF